MTTETTELDLFDRTGATTALHRLWAKRSTILVFVRHFG